MTGDERKDGDNKQGVKERKGGEKWGVEKKGDGMWRGEEEDKSRGYVKGAVYKIRP